MVDPQHKPIREHIENEVRLAELSLSTGDTNEGFRHLERAHVLGQSITYDHTRVHWQMLKIGWLRRDAREIFGQLIRIVGAATKTPFGIYPTGNTGGANVYFFKRMSIPNDLRDILDSSRR